MKKRATKLMSGLLAVGLLAGCGAKDAPAPPVEETGKTVEEMLGLDQATVPVYYEGTAYFQNPHVENFLILGIDQLGTAQESGSYNGGGQADVILLAIVDHLQKCYTILQINRDTMVDVDILGVRGDVVGTRHEQIALAHAYGTGMKDSCENAASAVSRFLYDAEIDGYVSLRMEAIPVLNDAVGGVTVTIEDDFSSDDPTLIEGATVTLMGDQALHFIRGRMQVGDGSNESRMRRNRTYMEALKQSMDAKLEEDPQFLIRLYDAVFPYMVTNIGSKTLTHVAEQCRDYENRGIVTLPGAAVDGEEFTEFHVEDRDVKELALQLFYLSENK